MTYRIIDLTLFSGLPTGNEIAEISNNGTGSFKIALSVFAYGRAANNVTSGGTTTIAFDDFGDVLVNFNGSVTIQLGPAGLRSGVPVSVVDIGGFAGANNITILPDGTEKIMGLSSVAITNAYGAWTLWPITTGGWYEK